MIAQNGEELARLLTREQGKPFEQAMGDVLGGAHWFAETAKMDIPEIVSQDDDERYTVTRYEPIGVVAAIVPWNFPIILAAFKLAPALLAGNTVVLKPAPTTPLTSLKLGELIKDIVPAGVVNIVADENDLGAALTAHPDVRKISFTAEA